MPRRLRIVLVLASVAILIGFERRLVHGQAQTDSTVAPPAVAPPAVAPPAVAPPAVAPPAVAPPASTSSLRSVLTAPLFLGDEPPPCRTLQLISLPFDAEGETDAGRSRAEALGLAWELRRQAKSEASFRALAVSNSSAPNAGFGAVLGTFPPGLLEPALEHFLWSAEEGDLSDPIETEGAILILRRAQRWAGCRLILVKATQAATAAQRMDAVLKRLAQGEDFREVARRYSSDPKSAARGGDFSVFERGNQDRSLKRALFETPLGQRVGPMETPLGLVLAERVPPAELEQDLWESNWARVRSLLISYREAGGPVELNQRPYAEALKLSQELAAQLQDGKADLADLAARYNDDLDGRERRGDLGWIRRNGSTTVSIIGRVFQEPSGNLIGPLPLGIGFLFLQREDP